MKAKVVAVTENNQGTRINPYILSMDAKEEMETISGKMAGICYMPHDYNTLEEQDMKKHINRYNNVIKTNHHSIAEHCYITIVLENISKIQAMILNSLEVYTTSEKSARYTNMSGDGPDIELYRKWMNIIEDLLVTNYGDNEDIAWRKLASKIAKENARYFISIYTQNTTMSYTTSLRQWNYILDWLGDFDRNSEGDRRLYLQVKELYTTILNTNIFESGLRDSKNRKRIDSFFIGNNTGVPVEKFKPSFDYNYLYSYNASYSALAQLQRHRTIRYSMDTKVHELEDRYYIPQIITDNGLEKQWLDDMESISYLVPQGMMITIYESGTLENFLLKCDERLCCRAQKEIRDITIDGLITYVSNNELAKEYAIENKYIRETENGFTVLPKCARIDCQEKCGYVSKFLTREW